LLPQGQDFDFTLASKDPGAGLSDVETTVRKPKDKPMRNKRPHGKANMTGDGGSEAAGDNMDAVDPKDEDLPDAEPAQESATPSAEEPKQDLVRLSAENPLESRDLEKDGELPGEESNSAIGAFNMFAVWRRAELSKEDHPNIDIRATLLAEWQQVSTSTKESLADKFTELGSSSKILEQIREQDWQPPSIPSKIVTKDATPPRAASPPAKDEDVEMGDGDASKSKAPADD
jgi:hypothetical protein